MTTKTKMTAEQLQQMSDDGFRCELLRGELHQMAPAVRERGKIALRFGSGLPQFVALHELGETFSAETGFVLSHDPDTVRAPDASFLRQQRVEETGPASGYTIGPPDLAVEGISPNDSYNYVHDKVIECLEAGTRMVAVVNPRRQTVTVYRSLTDIALLTGDDTLEGGGIVPGWQLPVGDLFA